LKKILQSSTKNFDEWNVFLQREHLEYRKAQVFDEKIQKIDEESKRKKRKVVVKEPEPLADYFPNDFEAYVKSNPRSGRMFIYRHMMLETIETRNTQIEKMSEPERKARRKRLGMK